MKAPVEGLAGRVWRLATKPVRLIAPVAALGGRAVAAEFWTETMRTSSGAGPDVEMAQREGIQHPRDGAGPLNHRSYRVHITGSQLTALELLDEFRRDPNRFSPTSFATFDPEPGVDGYLMNDALTVRLPGPWDGPVIVTGTSDRSLRLETREGHMEAGWIEFRSREVDDTLVFEIESFARSGDEAFDLLYHPAKIARWVQTEMWVRVLEAAVEVSGGSAQGRPIVETTVYRDTD